MFRSKLKSVAYAISFFGLGSLSLVFPAAASQLLSATCILISFWFIESMMSA